MTITLFVVSIKVYIYDLTVEALSKEGVVQVQKVESNWKKHVLRAIFLKGIPAMEVEYKKENIEEEKSIKSVFYKLMDMNYKDPTNYAKEEAESEIQRYAEDFTHDDTHTLGEVQPVEAIKIEQEPKVTEEKINENRETEKSEEKEVAKEEKEVKIVTSAAKKPKDKIKIVDGKPNIFVYHTHATESYLPMKEGNFHSLKRDYTVRKVGDVLTSELKENGFNVVHDETLHDYPSYRESYTRGLETLKLNMKKYPTAQLIIDIHRDAGGSSEESREQSYITIDKKKVAKFSMVVGTKNPNYKELVSLADYIKAVSDKLYPGLAKKTIKKPYKFNEYNSNHYILIEIGNTQNTIEEATETSKYVAKILNEVIKNLKE